MSFPFSACFARTAAAIIGTTAVIVLILLALPVCPSPVHAQDSAVVTMDDDPVRLRESVLEHRRAEAAIKAARLKAWSEAEVRLTGNQVRYDVHHYDLDLDVDVTAEILTGTVTVTAGVLADISTLDLDMDARLTVDGATSGASSTTYTHAAPLLTIDLDRTYTTGETVTVSVSYHGDPAGDAFGWSSHDSEPMIWTLSEPFGARQWWPCKDDPTDKADSLDVHVTVPNDLIVASQGLVVSDIDNGTTRTTHWHSDYPIATYLVSLAIHPYVVFSTWYTPQAGGDPMEIQNFVYADNYDNVQATYALVPDMIDVFARGYGEYPFVDEKYGQADFVWGGGMEHQTLTSLGWWVEDVVAHELAHQWWGDMITCADFHHVWLNEGFATWSEAYWREQTDGVATYRAYMDLAAFYGPGTIYVEDTSNFYTIFDGNLSYNKASWVVHMLRGVLGDDDFFAGLAAYRAAKEYGAATTEEFRDLMESVTSMDLDAFFQQWIYGEYFPIYRSGWSQDGTTLNLTIEQMQTDTGLFTMPIQVRVTTSTGVQDVTVQNSLASESYALTVDGDVLSVVIDPDDWILCRRQSAVSNPTFAEGILLVNGADWNTYGSEITSAYADSIYTGDHDFTFWDTFAEPTGGYPAELPAPIGHGAVPGDVIGLYSTVVWVGNNFNGDLTDWQETPIDSYLDTGGNVALITRLSADFLEGTFDDYLGIGFTNYSGTLGDCTAVYPGLVDIPFIGTQSSNDVYSTGVGPDSDLLFLDASGFDGARGTGVYAHPDGGGTLRETGAKFVHIAGRAYRLDHTALRQNMQVILDDLLDEPYDPLSPVNPDPEPLPVAQHLTLSPNYPNPFNPQTVIPYALPQAGPAELAVYDAGGRLVQVLLSGEQPAGVGQVTWFGKDRTGRAVASGTYFVRLKCGDEMRTRAVVLVR